MHKNTDDIKEIYQEDLTNKYKIGKSALTYKSGTYKHRLRSAADLMNPYQRRKYRKSGEVIVSNIFDQLMTREEFDEKTPEQQKNILIRWKELYANKEILKALNMGSATLYRLYDELDVPKARKGYKRNGASNKKMSIAEKAAHLQSQIKAQNAPEIIDPMANTQPMRILTQGLHLEYNGEFDAEQLSKIFTKLQLVTDGEENKFYLSISLTEKTE